MARRNPKRERSTTDGLLAAVHQMDPMYYRWLACRSTPNGSQPMELGKYDTGKPLKKKNTKAGAKALWRSKTAATTLSRKEQQLHKVHIVHHYGGQLE